MVCPVNSLAAALCATIALALASASGGSCSFVTVNAAEIDGSFGVYCQGDFDLEGDSMWILTRVFLSLAIVLGSISTAIAWTISVCTRHTRALWQTISITAALAAVLEGPRIFVI